MKTAVMQPYFLPYLGYFQLVEAVDQFVFFNDVNFIKKGWIHRNQLLLSGSAHRFSIPLSQASQNKKINEIRLADYPAWRAQFLQLVETGYKKAPNFPAIYDWLRAFLFSQEFTHIGVLAAESVVAVSRLLGLETKFLYSGQIGYPRSEAAGGEEKILSICRLLETTHYINPKNGAELYDHAHFSDAGITLSFIHMNEVKYDQFHKGEFVPYLSVLDVLMFNSTVRVREMLKEFSLKS